LSTNIHSLLVKKRLSSSSSSSLLRPLLSSLTALPPFPTPSNTTPVIGLRPGPPLMDIIPNADMQLSLPPLPPSPPKPSPPLIPLYFCVRFN